MDSMTLATAAYEASPSDRQTVAELNDFAVRTLRQIADDGGIKGLTRKSLRALLRQEATLMKLKGVETPRDYFRASRAGMRFAMTRRQRAIVFAAVVTFRKAK